MGGLGIPCTLASFWGCFSRGATAATPAPLLPPPGNIHVTTEWDFLSPEQTDRPGPLCTILGDLLTRGKPGCRWLA